jgi:hypothetical protein
MLKSTICGSVALRIKSPNFSTFKQAWKGSWSSEPARRVVTKLPREHETAARASRRVPGEARDLLVVELRESRAPRSDFTRNRTKNHPAPSLVETRRIDEVNTGRGPLITMFGKSSKCTSSGSSMPLRVTMICLGCSSTGSERMRAATCDRGRGPTWRRGDGVP